MPLGIYGHCLLKLNETHFALIGGHDGKKLNPKSFFFTMEGGSQWVEGPRLRTSRKYHSCALLHFSNFKIMVVAGGVAKAGKPTSEVEFLNLEAEGSPTRQMQWIKGKNVRERTLKPSF